MNCGWRKYKSHTSSRCIHYMHMNTNTQTNTHQTLKPPPLHTHTHSIDMYAWMHKECEVVRISSTKMQDCNRECARTKTSHLIKVYGCLKRVQTMETTYDGANRIERTRARLLENIVQVRFTRLQGITTTMFLSNRLTDCRHRTRASETTFPWPYIY